MYEESAYEDEMNEIRREIQEECQESMERTCSALRRRGGFIRTKALSSLAILLPAQMPPRTK